MPDTPLSCYYAFRHEWLALHVVRFLIAPLRTQCVGQEMPRLDLGP